MGYSWKGPPETTLSNPLTHGEILRASSPRPCPQHLNTARHGVPTSSLSNLSLCLVILTVKVCFLVFRRSLLCIFVPAASGPVCGYHWTVSLLFAPSSQVFIYFDMIPLPERCQALLWGEIIQSQPLNHLCLTLSTQSTSLSKWRSGFCSFFFPIKLQKSFLSGNLWWNWHYVWNSAAHLLLIQITFSKLESNKNLSKNSYFLKFKCPLIFLWTLLSSIISMFKMQSKKPIPWKSFL